MSRLNNNFSLNNRSSSKLCLIAYLTVVGGGYWACRCTICLQIYIYIKLLLLLLSFLNYTNERKKSKKMCMKKTFLFKTKPQNKSEWTTNERALSSSSVLRLRLLERNLSSLSLSVRLRLWTFWIYDDA